MTRIALIDLNNITLNCENQIQNTHTPVTIALVDSKLSSFRVQNILPTYCAVENVPKKK